MPFLCIILTYVYANLDIHNYKKKIESIKKQAQVQMKSYFTINLRTKPLIYFIYSSIYMLSNMHILMYAMYFKNIIQNTLTPISTTTSMPWLRLLCAVFAKIVVSVQIY